MLHEGLTTQLLIIRIDLLAKSLDRSFEFQLKRLFRVWDVFWGGILDLADLQGTSFHKNSKPLPAHAIGQHCPLFLFLKAITTIHGIYNSHIAHNMVYRKWCIAWQPLWHVVLAFCWLKIIRIVHLRLVTFRQCTWKCTVACLLYHNRMFVLLRRQQQFLLVVMVVMAYLPII